MNISKMVATRINVNAISLEHASSLITYHINTAPKHCNVYGLNDNMTIRKLLLSFDYYVVNVLPTQKVLSILMAAN